MPTASTAPRGPDASQAWPDLAARILDDLLDRDPVLATGLGDHARDDRLPDPTEAGRDSERRALDAHLADIDELGAVGGLPPDDQVDLQILRSRVAARLFGLDELRDHEWDPVTWNPGPAIYPLLARDFAPLPDRLRSVASRLSQVPAYLEGARASLGAMPAVAIETAIGQFGGTCALLTTEIDEVLTSVPSLRAEIEPVRAAALAAIDSFVIFLRQRLADPASSGRDPRLGPELYARKLATTLDGERDPASLLDAAYADLARVEEQIVAVAAGLGGDPASVLQRLADEGFVDDGTILPLCRKALADTRQFVLDAALVTVYDDPVEIIVMPELHRGVAVAYCDAPGPLEVQRLPTYFAVSPTPADWSAERVRSFYREYNAHMLHNLTAHEAMPGHVLQLAHARRYAGRTAVRAACWSGPFVEGWAVVAEELMADRGYPGAGSPGSMRMQQLKMALRMILNTILDVRVHCDGLPQAEAMTLMTSRGYQEEGEAAGKWRRALLTSTQLSTYYAGYRELSDLLPAVRAARPHATDREIHDSLLAHGSLPPRHLRTLIL